MIQELTHGKENAEINGVFVFEGDVYLTGYVHNGRRDVATYWKNGISINLTNGLAHANAMEIVVVKEKK